MADWPGGGDDGEFRRGRVLSLGDYAAALEDAMGARELGDNTVDGLITDIHRATREP